MSALHGDMVVERGARMAWYGGPTLLQILEAVELPQSSGDEPFRFPVQYVTRPAANEPRGYLGRIESGSIRVGERVTALPSGLSTRVRAIRTYDGSLPEAGLHASVALVLDDELDISRGDMLVPDYDAPPARRELEAMTCWLADTPLDPRRRYLLRHTTREVPARIRRIEHLWNVSTQEEEEAPASLQRNDIALVALQLAQPVFAERYADNRATGSFILIDESSNDTVAAGMVR
jgi:sulfate adenylyltransferase subunit 1